MTLSVSFTSIRTLLVTGASGVLGWNVCAAAQEWWRTVAIVLRHPIDLPGVSRLTCDLTHPGELRRLFQEVAPEAVVHCAAAASPDLCEAQPDESRRINVEVAPILPGLCAAQIPCVRPGTWCSTARALRTAKGTPSPHQRLWRQKRPRSEVARERSGRRHLSPAPDLRRSRAGFGELYPAMDRSVARRKGTQTLHGRVSGAGRRPNGGRGIAHGTRRRRWYPPPGRTGAGFTLRARDHPGPDTGGGRRPHHAGRRRDRGIEAPRPADVSLDSSRSGYDPPSLRGWRPCFAISLDP
jgi:hypothetical protein